MSIFKLIKNNKNKKNKNKKNKNNENNNNNEIKLNFLIFNEILIYLIYYNFLNFKNLLDTSLISKSTFKSFKNLIISYRFSKIKFVIPNEIEFFKYVLYKSKSNNHLTDEQRYQLKLIQYRDIEYITFGYHLDYKYKYHNKQINEKQCLKYYCKNLKEIKILEMCIPYCQSSSNSNSNNSNLYDYTQGGLYKFKRLNWHFKLSNQFFELINPEKLIISLYNVPTIEQEDFILNNKSVNSIFLKDGYNSSIVGKLLKKTSSTVNNEVDQSQPQTQQLQHHHIKSLVLTIKPNEFISNSNYPLVNFKNSTLKKLILLNIDKKSYSPKSLFQTLENNESIEKLGLFAYNIKNSSDLEPIKKLKNISTLYCDYSNFKSLKAHLDHCNQNTNIKKLKLSDDSFGNYYLIHRSKFSKKHFNAIINFMKTNKTLNSLVWNFSDLNNYFYSKFLKYKNNLKNQKELLYTLYEGSGFENYYKKKYNLIIKFKHTKFYGYYINT